MTTKSIYKSGEIFKIFGKGEGTYMGDLSILWGGGGLDNPFETWFRQAWRTWKTWRYD